ncbi:MAG: HAMP domain-containing histidine kinase [Chitinophagaceae bacterium]|nr:HAMP domain-containing histidine kinase [Chitinophagaceae bacterium]MBP9103902.1 HAMP domain-containing histidine kinase [Chitinophagaceae bacterium]
MLAKRLTILPLLLYFSIALGQTNEKLLVEKKQACEKILAEFTGKPESLELLIKTGTEGLALSSEKDHEYKFLFHQAIGTGYYYKQDFTSASQHFEEAYSEATKANLVEKSIKPLGNLVLIYHYMGLQGKADTTAQKLKQIAETNDTLKNKSDIYYNLGVYNQQQKFYYGIALDNFLKSVSLGKAIADTTKTVKLKTDYAVKNMMVADVYLFLKQPEKALQYLEVVKPYLGLSAIVDITAYGKFVRSYVELDNQQEATTYYNLLNDVITQSPGKWSEAVSSNLELADLFLKKGDLKTAKFYIDKADKQSKLDNKEILTSSVNLSYGEYYKAMKNYPQAINYYGIAAPGTSIYNKEQYADLLKSLTYSELQVGDKNALASFDKYTQLTDSLTQSKISLNLAEMEAVYQNENKQQQIVTKNIQLSTARTQRLWLIAGIALAALIAILLIIIYRNKKKTADLLNEKNKKLAVLNTELNEANQTKAKLFSIIGHDLRSPISQVYQFLKLQQLNPDALNREQKNELSNKIQTATGSLLETMEDLLLWSKTQMNEFKPNLQPVDIASTIESCKQLLQLNSAAKNITYNQKIESSIIETDSNFLQTILRNLLQNAIKASPQNGVIEIVTSSEKNSFKLHIKNEGGSFSQQQYFQSINTDENAGSLNGLGLKLVDELSGKIGATVFFKTTTENTTWVEVLFPKE